MTFLAAFVQVAILFVLIVTGYVSRKIGVLDLALTRGLSRFIVTLTLPCLAISSLQTELSREKLAEAALVLAVMAGSYILYAVFAWLAPRLLAISDRRDAAIYRFFMIFPNTGFMGYPVVEAFLGKEALFYAVIFNIPYLILFFSVGVGIIAFAGDRAGEKRGIPWKSPGILASVIGLALFLMPFRLPVILAQPLRILADLTAPLSLIVVGSFLTHVRLAELGKGWRLYAGSFLRLLGIPLAVYAIL
ncbi:MAG: AEC family transporter, partial [Spirochaetaceae bacterium]|nr:AEC family transporter [Spirochaetaceae bacterium]